MLQVMGNVYDITLVGREDNFSKEKWDTFKEDIDYFAILKWNVEYPTLSMDFLDLIPKPKIDDGNNTLPTFTDICDQTQYIQYG